MRLSRKLLPLLVSVGLVLAVGALAFQASAGANRKAQAVHAGDRSFLQNTLADLGNQYVLLSLKEMVDFSETHDWSLRPGDVGDRALLQEFVGRSATLNHGASLVALSGTPLNQWSKAPGLPPPTDRGYQPLITGLLSKKPGLSSVMKVGGVPVVAMAIGFPIDAPRALFVAYFNAAANPLQVYNEKLHYGETGHTYTLDSRGGILASDRRELVGATFRSTPVLRELAQGKRGFLEYTLDGKRLVATYAPIDIGGWGAVTEQTAGEFFGPIRSSGLRVRYALLAMLVVAAAGLAVMNHKRQIALKKAYDYKGELLANTTHELKTPLTAIRGAAMTLGVRWRDMEPEQVDTFLGIVHRRCDGLGKLIERILIGARLEAGREISLHPAPLQVAGALRRTAADFEDASPRHEIRVDAPEGVWVAADADALDQVLGLLVENAIKYSPDGGEVRIEAERRGEVVEYRVADQGIGIGEEDRQHVFEPYFKASRGDVQRFAGVGLGLPIARHLVRCHGGDIRVSSAPGEGSVFSFTMPACEPPRTEVAEPLVQVG